MNKDDFLKLSGFDATKYAKEHWQSGKWNLDQYLKMLRFWQKYHNDIENNIKEVFGT